MDTNEELSARIDALLLRVDASESILAIHALKARYAGVVDARFSHGQVVADDRLAELAREASSLFTEDGVWDGGPGLGIARGRAEIAARLAEPTLVFSRHFFVNPRIMVEGDRAPGDGTCCVRAPVPMGSRCGCPATRTTPTPGWTGSGSMTR